MGRRTQRRRGQRKGGRAGRTLRTVLRCLLWLAVVALGMHAVYCGYIAIRALPLRTAYPGTVAIIRHRSADHPPRFDPHLRLPLDEVPRDLVWSVLYVEDARFFEHAGYSIESIRYAVDLNRRLGYRAYGGSTITQQLARTLFLTPRKSYLRKYLELIAAIELEVILDKRRILELYLNCAEWGPGVYGVAEASDYHFGRIPSELTLEEKLTLVTLLPSPLRFTPDTFGQSEVLTSRFRALERFADRALRAQPVFQSELRRVR